MLQHCNICHCNYPVGAGHSCGGSPTPCSRPTCPPVGQYVLSPDEAESFGEALRRSANVIPCSECSSLRDRVKELEDVIKLGVYALPALHAAKGYDKIVEVWLARARTALQRKGE